jgi:hypothetical protein
MTPDKIQALFTDARRLAAALADKELLPLIPVTPAAVRALPIQLAPFQARWLLGNCSDETLAAFRELHPAIVVQRFGDGTGARYRYSKTVLCQVGAVPTTDHEPQRTPNHHH